MTKLVAYCRVSTKQQGLGLEAQQQIIREYAARNGAVIVAEYSEKESGKDTAHRPQLAAAIDAARLNKATLIVAKLDRLSRDVADVFMLKKRGIDFVVCDINAADTMMLGIFATLAQKERELISTRTRQALAALKAKGVKLGNPKAAEHARTIYRKGNEARKEAADRDPNNVRAWHAIRLMSGTLQSKADWLNENGYRTPRGGMYSPTQVARLVARFSA